MTITTWTTGPYTLTIYGGGTSATLRRDGRSIHWQGDEAVEVTDLYAEHGPVALDRLWDDYSELATED